MSESATMTAVAAAYSDSHAVQCFRPLDHARESFQREPIEDFAHGANHASVAHSVSRGALLFPLLWVFIGFVSAFDAYLTVRFQEFLAFEEQNPVGLMVLSLSDWKADQFIGFKYMGTTLVLGTLTALYSRKPSLGLTVTSAIAAFQFLLLCYLIL